MKIFFYSCLVLFVTLSNTFVLFANEPDSAYIFAYGTNKDDGRGGLYFAWSVDRDNWNPIAHTFLSCDFGRWGSQKRMHEPVLIQDNNGQWHCLWTLNNEVGIISHTTSSNLTYWKPQSYPYVFEGKGNCRMIEVGYDSQKDGYFISWVSTIGEKGLFGTSTEDFKHFETAGKIPEIARVNQRDVINMNGEEYTGTIHKVAWSAIDHLIKTKQLAEYKNTLFNEKMADDHVRFAGLKSVDATISINPGESKKISDMLIGIFFEDINYAADGGLYAELIQNRGFEYAPGDKEDRDTSWNSSKAWSLRGDYATFSIDTAAPIHENNKHYAVLNIRKTGASLINEGFDGIALKKGEKYDFSIFARSMDGQSKKLKLRLVDENGKVLGEATTKTVSSAWKKYCGVIIAKESTVNSSLEIIPLSEGTIALDMISLFPQKTFKNRKNGLRADLAQTLADMKPRFVRFPGGCVAHGDGLGNMYRWINTVGPTEARKPQRNLWGYHQSMGLGYYEYFQFCEDIGAEPLPVLPAGVPCQNSGTGGHGQQCGIPMDEMQEYIQEVLDLVEWANGDPKKNKWAKMRADAGHPEPFNLKYIGIGNEDLISEVFEERFTMICNAIKEKYPELIIVGTAGPFYEGSDYTEGWRIATETGTPLIDEHYYVPPAWFIHNQDFYDRYDRNKSKVYLGEYAAHVNGRHNNIETALTEALHLANVERNGDIVALTSYAPLLAKEGHTQWNPDLIYFNNTEVKPTVGYFVQQLYGQNSGTEYLPSLIILSDKRESVQKRVVCSVVRDSKTNDLIIKLINLLPTGVNINMDIDALNINTKEVVKTVLTGKPDDKNARPVESKINLPDVNKMTLPAYSFTVIRCKMQ